MSSSYDIAGVRGHAAAPSPAPPQAAVARPHLGGVFQRTFASSMATVFERGAAGEFDDPTLRLEEQAALERLRRARAAASESIGSTGASRGARGAPRAPGAAAAAGSGPGSAAALAAEQRQLHDVRVRQSEARLSNISASLARDFPHAAELAPASTGSWDPDAFVPRTAAEAEAFAHRMVIDATEGAARLEIVKTQLDAARFEAAHGGGPAAGARAAELEAAYDRQRAYVDKLSRIVDQQSGGQVAEAGVLALGGTTMRTSGDAPVQELAAELRASGMDEAQVRRVIGATELAVEQERAPGGSERLRRVASDMTAALVTRFNLVREQRRDEFRRQEDERAQERRREDTVRARQRADEQRQQQAARREAQEHRAAERAAEFEQWLATLAAAAAARRREVS